MNRRPKNLLWQAVAVIVARKVQRFRLVHVWLQVALGVALIGAVVCLDWWLPRWPVYLLTSLLVLDALLHAWINRVYSESEIRAWQQVLGLADLVMHQAGIEAAIKVTPPNPARKFLYGPRPRLRVVRPDEEPPSEQA